MLTKPAEPAPSLPEFKLLTSVQLDPSQTSVSAMSAPGAEPPPNANAAVCIPAPPIFISSSSI